MIWCPNVLATSASRILRRSIRRRGVGGDGEAASEAMNKELWH